jgi:hypothetical protein
MFFYTKEKLQLLHNNCIIMVSWLVVAVQLIMKSGQPHQPSYFSSGIREDPDTKMGHGVSRHFISGYLNIKNNKTYD